MRKQDIKETLAKIKTKNINLIQCRIDYHRSKKDDMKVLDEKIRRTLVESIFTEIEMAFEL